MAQPIRFPATVEQVTHHTPNVATYRLRADKRLPRFIPGQFIHLTLEPFDPASFWPESRVFSVANAVADRRTVELTISRQGAYTNKVLDQLSEGDRIWAKGPYGDFTIDANLGYSRAVLIAGGTGITPFCAFMDAALSQGRLPIEQATLYYGAQTPDLLLYRALADRCVAEVPGFQAHYFAEQGADETDDSIHPGRIDLAEIMRDCIEPESTAFFLSGPKPMIEMFRDSLTTSYGLSPEQVLIDAWELIAHPTSREKTEVAHCVAAALVRQSPACARPFARSQGTRTAQRTARYSGYSKHKAAPQAFGLPSDTKPRDDSTLCDTHAGFTKDQIGSIPRLLRRGIRAGLVGILNALDLDH